MGSAYTIFGKQVQAHWISIATLTTVIGGVVLPKYLPGSSEPAATPVKAPEPVAAAPADDIDVEKLLNDFLKDNEEKK